MTRDEAKLLVDNITREYSELIKKYPQIVLDHGCGCCSGGHRVVDENNKKLCEFDLDTGSISEWRIPNGLV